MGGFGQRLEALQRPRPGGPQGVEKIVPTLQVLDLTAVIFFSSILVNEKFIAINFAHKEHHGQAYLPATRDVLVHTALVAVGQTDRRAQLHSGVATVAEGVEQAGEVALLRETGCDELQGDLFARPMPADELAVWARERRPVSTAGQRGARQNASMAV